MKAGGGGWSRISARREKGSPSPEEEDGEPSRLHGIGGIDGERPLVPSTPRLRPEGGWDGYCLVMVPFGAQGTAGPPVLLPFRLVPSEAMIPPAQTNPLRFP